MQDIYKNIRSLRIQNNMSQAELADAIGYTDRSSIAKIEKGEVDLSQSKIEAFASVFHVSIDYLLGLTENPSPRVPAILDFAEEFGLDSDDAFLTYIHNLGYETQRSAKEYQISFDDKKLTVSLEEFEQMKKELSDYMFFNIWSRRLTEKSKAEKT